MRPIIAILGAAFLVAIALAAYFVPAGYADSGTVYAGSPQVVQVTPGYTILAAVPVTLTINSLPPGANVEITPCPMGATTAAQCSAGSAGFLDEYNNTANVVYSTSITLHFDINAGHPFLITTTASYGAKTTFQVASPFWAVYTILLIVVLIAGIVLVAVGLHHQRPVGPAPVSMSYVDQSGYAAGPAPKLFCETCGTAYPEYATPTCLNCGAPRV